MKHKNAEVIIAWANGETIQYKENDQWVNLTYHNNDNVSPNWNDSNIEWRVKPKFIKYRLALMFDESYGYYVNAENSELDRSALSSFHFVKWLSDWIEIEV